MSLNTRKRERFIQHSLFRTAICSELILSLQETAGNAEISAQFHRRVHFDFLYL